MLITVLCSCGCNTEIQREKRVLKRFPRSFVSGHQFKNALNVNWQGGIKHASGYVFVLKPEHPNANKNRYVRQHVLVMSEHLGRALEKHEIVHHLNGIKDDNRLENLVLMTRAQHHSHHHKGLMKPNSLKNLRPMTSEWGKRIWQQRRAKARSPFSP